MNTSANPTAFTPAQSPDPSSTTPTMAPLPYRAVLLAVYSVVMVSGTIGVGLAVHILKSSMRSITTVAVLNLICAHLLFLLTVPLRLYYYAATEWSLSPILCKATSAMVHIHMYMAFVLYVVILVTRLLTFYGKANQVEFYRKLHALGASLAVWVIVLVVMVCVVCTTYGKVDKHGNDPDDDLNKKYCFRFGNRLRRERYAQVFNYLGGSLIVAGACVLTGLQANVLLSLRRKYGRGCWAQQVFWAQVKSFCIALVMLVCFVPYHLFRLYYISHVKELEEMNEVFLSLTALCCFDMLTFMGRNACCVCDSWTA